MSRTSVVNQAASAVWSTAFFTAAPLRSPIPGVPAGSELRLHLPAITLAATSATPTILIVFMAGFPFRVPCWGTAYGMRLRGAMG